MNKMNLSKLFILLIIFTNLNAQEKPDWKDNKEDIKSVFNIILNCKQFDSLYSNNQVYFLAQQ